METRDVYAAISYAPEERLRKIVEARLSDSEAYVTSPPTPALVMARVRETVDGEVFNLGEVLVTTCEVTLDGEPGWGMVMGHDPDRSVLVAILDAASRRGDRALEDDLSVELAAVYEARRERWASVQDTRVAFEEMS